MLFFCCCFFPPIKPLQSSRFAPKKLCCTLIGHHRHDDVLLSTTLTTTTKMSTSAPISMTSAKKLESNYQSFRLDQNNSDQVRHFCPENDFSLLGTAKLNRWLCTWYTREVEKFPNSNIIASDFLSYC